MLFRSWATSATGPITLSWAGLTNATPRLLAHYGLWSGIACYGVSVIIWIIALSRAQVSTVYPLLSIGYIVNAVGATLLLGEALPATKLAGIGVIVVGVFLLTQSH